MAAALSPTYPTTPGFFTGVNWLSRFASVWVMVAAVAVLMFAEANRLINEIPAANGRVHSIGDVIGPLSLLNVDAWKDWASAGDSPIPLLLVHTGLDIFFFVAYGLLAWRVVRRSSTARATLYWLIIFEVAELLLLLASYVLLSIDITILWLGILLASVSLVKWLLTVLLIAVVLFGAVRRHYWPTISEAAKALVAQKLSLIVVLFLGFMALMPGSGVLEQIADVERSWIYTAPRNGLAFDLPGVAAAMGTLGFVALALFFAGRLRAQQFVNPVGNPTIADWRMYRPYLVVILVVLVAGLPLALFLPSVIDVGPWLLFLGIVAVLVALSLAARRIRSKYFATYTFRGDSAPAHPPSAQSVKQAGDLLVALLLAFAVLALVRSFTAPVLLQLYPGTFDNEPATRRALVLSALALAAGIVLSILSLSVMRGAIARISARIERSAARGSRGTLSSALSIAADDTDDVRVQRWARAVTVVAAMLLLSFLFFPVPMSTIFGSLGTITVLLGSWATIFAAVIIFLRGLKPLELFRLAGMHTTPFLTLFVALPIVVTQFGGAPALHAIQNPSGIEPAKRDTLDEAFTHWLARSAGCVAELDVGAEKLKVRPLVLVAAEGGGIRAATWTVEAFTTLTEDGECARSAVMLSSGVSGGSVGLTMFRNDADGSAPTVDAPLSGDDSLASAVAGAFVGDLIGALTGIRVPTGSGYGADGSWQWQDRAALLQSGWISTSPQLGTAYDTTATEPTGLLVLNSTDALSRCKVLVSQVNLNIGTGDGDIEAGESVNSCEGESAELAGTLDLRNFYGKDCPYELDWASAALASARFPIITPAARVADRAGCDVDGDLQLIDGGYVENSGLGTLSDLSPDLAQLVAEYNARADGTSRPYVIPIVLYLRNEPGADVTAPPTDAKPELFIPVASKLSAPGLQTEPSSWLTRLSNTLEDVCSASRPDDSSCDEALAAVRARIPLGIIVAAPTTKPGMEVPLGWALSDLSRDRLSQEMEAQSTCLTKPEEVAQASHGCLGDLLELIP